MASIQCDYCRKEAEKRYFCSGKCRKKYGRLSLEAQKELNIRPKNGQMEVKRPENGQKEEIRPESGQIIEAKRPESGQKEEWRPEIGQVNLPNRFKPALSWRDDKGQCQHKLKACQACKV